MSLSIERERAKGAALSGWGERERLHMGTMGEADPMEDGLRASAGELVQLGVGDVPAPVPSGEDGRWMGSSSADAMPVATRSPKKLGAPQPSKAPQVRSCCPLKAIMGGARVLSLRADCPPTAGLKTDASPHAEW
jgi:hypothetical protein